MKLIFDLVLAYADILRPFILEIDASYSGLGAVHDQLRTPAEVFDPLSAAC